MKPTPVTIDAFGKKLGRVASEAASILIGKNRTDVTRNNVHDVSVTITNASKAAITEKKLEQKEYKTYTGYPGGLNTESLKQLVARKGYAEAFRLAVYNMIPSNKLRKQIMKNLTITE